MLICPGPIAIPLRSGGLGGGSCPQPRGAHPAPPPRPRRCPPVRTGTVRAFRGAGPGERARATFDWLLPLPPRPRRFPLSQTMCSCCWRSPECSVPKSGNNEVRRSLASKTKGRHFCSSLTTQQSQDGLNSPLFSLPTQPQPKRKPTFIKIHPFRTAAGCPGWKESWLLVFPMTATFPVCL